jgi:acyl-CoA hydrolase
VEIRRQNPRHASPYRFGVLPLDYRERFMSAAAAPSLAASGAIVADSARPKCAEPPRARGEPAASSNGNSMSRSAARFVAQQARAAAPVATVVDLKRSTSPAAAQTSTTSSTYRLTSRSHKVARRQYCARIIASFQCIRLTGVKMSSHPAAPLDRSETTFRFLAEPSSVNFGGKVHGGALMKWIDETAYACAAVWSGRYCVTVSVGNIRFRRPILVGNLVELRARVVATGRTSMHIHVSVQAGDPKGGELLQTTDCLVVMVAVNENGSPVQVPSFVPETDEQKRLARYAMDVKEALDAIVELKPEEVAQGKI